MDTRLNALILAPDMRAPSATDLWFCYSICSTHKYRRWTDLNALILAPDMRAPSAMDLWFCSSDKMRSLLPTMAGSTSELVAKPIPTTNAAGLPTNRAISSSSSS